MSNYRNQWRQLPDLSDADARVAYEMRCDGASISDIMRHFGTSWNKANAAATRGGSLSPPDAPEPTRPIAGQCRGCACHTRETDFTTDTFGLTVRRVGTCRRDQTAAEDVLAGIA